MIFSWIVFRSRAHRDRVNAKVMQDPRLRDMMDRRSLPLDTKRLFWGGIKSIVAL